VLYSLLGERICGYRFYRQLPVLTAVGVPFPCRCVWLDKVTAYVLLRSLRRIYVAVALQSLRYCITSSAGTYVAVCGFHRQLSVLAAIRRL